MARPMSDKRLAEIREDLSHPTRIGYGTALELLDEVERLRALQVRRVAEEQVGAVLERKAVIAWLYKEAGAYLTKGREGADLAAALERGEHLTEPKK